MPTALVTGASSGIGRAFAQRLARDGFDLVLVGRDASRLDDVAATLGVPVEVLAADLGVSADLARVEHRLRDDLRPVDVLVNNAGYGIGKSFVATTVDEDARLLAVMVTAVLRLTHAAVPGMRERGGGTIVNVSSVSGYLPRGTYSSAKAWVTSFSEGLHYELAGSGIRVLAICPGFTRTEFHQRANIRIDLPSLMWMSPEQVVDDTLRALTRGRGVRVMGGIYRGLIGAARLAPRSLVARLSRRQAPECAGRPSPLSRRPWQR